MADEENTETITDETMGPNAPDKPKAAKAKAKASRRPQGSPKGPRGADPEWAEASKARPANIKYVGKMRERDPETGRTRETRRPADRVPTLRRNGDREFKMPPGQVQLDGFWHRDAEFLIRSYGDEFKTPTGKGD